MRSCFVQGGLGLLLLAVVPSAALAYDEGVSGDLSSNENAPTPLVFALGENIVAGSVTSTAPADTRDYITFTIPVGQRLAALRQVAWTDLPGGGPGNRGFHAINAGATSFVPSGTTDNNFLGGDHMDPLPSGTDLLFELSDGDIAGTGFTVPLGPGTYSYLVQQTGPQLNRYDLRFVLESSAAPVPATRLGSLLVLGFSLMLAGATVIGWRTRQRA